MDGSGSQSLYRMTDYEVRCSERYRRFFSLVFMASSHEVGEFMSQLGGSLRNSDEFADFNGHSAILMGETDKKDAMQAVKRLGRECNGSTDIRFSVTSYPKDGTTSDELFRTALERLERAKSGDVGAVVDD